MGANKEKESKYDQATISQILSGSSKLDSLLLFVALLVTILIGFDWSIFNIIFGKVVEIFVKFELEYNNLTLLQATQDELVHDFMNDVYFWSGLTVACGAWHIVGNFITLYCLQLFALRRMRAIKKRYLAAILKQEIAWFDRQSSGEFASRITSDFKKFESAINENLGILIYHISAIVISLGIGFYYGWKLSLSILSLAPLIGASAIISTKLQAKYAKKSMESNSEASSVAEEAISAIRTVFAFSGQSKERARYELMVKPAMRNGCKRNLVSAIDSSIGWATVYSSLAIGVWYGVKLMLEEGYSVGDVVIIYWSITFCGFNIGYCAPYLETFKIGRTAAAGIFKIIERNSEIDSSSKEGKKLDENYKTDIELKNVHFNYPTRSEVSVLSGLNLKVNKGEIVALVGSSGCGKSTIIQLIQRFYDPNMGEVLLDGVNIKDLNVGWLREQIGVVGQEPVLFDSSIEENIRLGMAVSEMNSITHEDVVMAAKEANAHEFIEKLQDGYGTYVGDRGAQLSGGQKQRIAIARALIAKPKILLLDEATSALDLKSEHVVQTALDRASKGRTTIIVAHRLSTIINADRIVVLDSGKVLEMGTHQELMKRESAYYNLVKAQQVGDSSNSAKKELNDNKDDGVTVDEIDEILSEKDKNKDKEIVEDEQELQQQKAINAPYRRLFGLIWLDKYSFITALTSAILYGMATPVYALIFGGFVDTFAETNDADYLRSESIKYAIFFVVLAVAIFTVNVLQIALFGNVGEKLTMRLRMMAFSAIMNQEVAWFDDPANSTGALCSRLADDAANVQGLTGLRIAIMCQAMSSLVCSVVIGFIFNWRMALVSLALMPLVAISSIISSQLYSGQAKQDGKTARASGKVLIEVMNAMRTVVSLHKEDYFFDNFSKTLQDHFSAVKPKIFWKSLLIATSLGATFFAYAIGFCYGGYLLSNRYLHSGDFFRIVECMIFGALIIGETTILTADYAKAKMSAFNIFALIDRKNNKMVVQCEAPRNGRSEGNLYFRGLHFHYPNRPDSTVLDGLSFSANKGETVALVGSSGCGKSTTIQLLEQFYEYEGQIELDGKDIAKLNTDWARSQMALVSQEPILFSYSIKDNIAYGDNSRTVPFEDIVRVAQMANVHDFVQKLPQGYDTPVGSKGAQLSGGQKQRIAIARALVRDPPILLLDEATSALDTASEKIVQEALDAASKGRTCIVIAHRLKTIVNANKIVVINKGTNVEEGSHEQLLEHKGHYWQLYNSAVACQ